MKLFADVEELKEAEGTELGVSEWVAVTQEMVDRFGDVTGSDDWIHTDPERAASGPFGVAIAQGDLLLSLVPRLLLSLYRLEGDHIGMVYGSDKVRFPSSVPVSSRLRVRGHVVDVTTRRGDILLKILATVEVENQERPALAAEVIHLYRTGSQ